jgi:hypothetical protein
MKESTKEWLGIKPADLVIDAAFLLLVPVYYYGNQAIDAVCLSLGLLLCLASCWLGMRPHPELGKVNNTIKLLAYPACTLFFLYVGYLNYSSWQ